MTKITPVLLCGGSGSRLWPLSRKSNPKQFADLLGDDSLFQAAAKRFSGPLFQAPVIVTNEDFRFIVNEQLAAANMGAQSVLIEPSARNTAAAICAAAVALEKTDPQALMLAAPSDHAIADAEAFRQTVQAACAAAEAGSIITFGIKPTRAETGYGWLELETAVDDGKVTQPLTLTSFVEKPKPAKVETLLASGRHYWNAGIFLFSVASLIAEYEKHQPAMLAAVRRAYAAAELDLNFVRLASEPWNSLEDISVDYAIMEHASNLQVMPYVHSWSDLGGWDAVWRELDGDETGTVQTGNALAVECQDTLLISTADSQQLVGLGLDGIVAVAMPDAVLIADKNRTQDVKKIVPLLKDRGARQAETFPRDFRPWGWFESLVIGNRFQVKQLVVKPGASLSLQSHHHRAEHWIVVEGTAQVTVDETVKLVTENQSIYVPLGAIHRVANPGKVTLKIIEVQTGSYLGEDDIVRYKDVYKRS